MINTTLHTYTPQDVGVDRVVLASHDHGLQCLRGVGDLTPHLPQLVPQIGWLAGRLHLLISSFFHFCQSFSCISDLTPHLPQLVPQIGWLVGTFQSRVTALASFKSLTFLAFYTKHSHFIPSFFSFPFLSFPFLSSDQLKVAASDVRIGFHSVGHARAAYHASRYYSRGGAIALVSHGAGQHQHMAASQTFWIAPKKRKGNGKGSEFSCDVFFLLLLSRQHEAHD
jgi:hypothetical protein